MAYDPTTPHSLLSRAEAIARHIGSVAVGLGHEGVLKLEQLVGLAPKPEPVEVSPAAPVAPATVPAAEPDSQFAGLQAAMDQLHQERGRLDDLLTKASGQSRPADVSLPEFAATIIDGLQKVAIDRGDKLIAANDTVIALTNAGMTKDSAISDLTSKLDTASKTIAALQTPATPAPVPAPTPTSAAPAPEAAPVVVELPGGGGAIG